MAPLREVRTKMLLTVRDLAARAGVAHGTVHLIETGQRIPHLSTIRRLSEALGVAPEEVDEFQTAIDEANRGKDAA